jgi:hypothetical protein
MPAFPLFSYRSPMVVALVMVNDDFSRFSRSCGGGCGKPELDASNKIRCCSLLPYSLQVTHTLIPSYDCLVLGSVERTGVAAS